MFRPLAPSSALYLLSTLALLFFPFPGVSEKKFLFQISDIHGDYEVLVWLIRHLIIEHVKGNTRLDPATDKFVFTGDVTDRGPKPIECYRLIHDLMDGRRNEHGFKTTPPAGTTTRSKWKPGEEVFTEDELALRPDSAGIPVTALLGNHEVFQLFQNVRYPANRGDVYVSEADKKSFGDLDMSVPPEKRGREWARGGSLGNFVAEHFKLVAVESLTTGNGNTGTIIPESKTLFIHAGPDFSLFDPIEKIVARQEPVPVGLTGWLDWCAFKFGSGAKTQVEMVKPDDHNLRIQQQLSKALALPKVGSSDDLDYRELSSAQSSKIEFEGDFNIIKQLTGGREILKANSDEINSFLSNFDPDAKRMVVGHTVTGPDSIDEDKLGIEVKKAGFNREDMIGKPVVAFEGGLVLFTDVGMSRWIRPERKEREKRLGDPKDSEGPFYEDDLNNQQNEANPAYPSVLVMEWDPDSGSFQIYFVFATIKKSSPGAEEKFEVVGKIQKREVFPKLAEKPVDFIPAAAASSSFSQISSTKGLDPPKISSTKGLDPPQIPTASKHDPSPLTAAPKVDAAQITVVSEADQATTIGTVCAWTLVVTLVSLAALRVWGRFWESAGKTARPPETAVVDANTAAGPNTRADDESAAEKQLSPSERSPEDSVSGSVGEGSGSQEASNTDDRTEVAESEGSR